MVRPEKTSVLVRDVVRHPTLSGKIDFGMIADFCLLFSTAAETSIERLPSTMLREL